MAKKVIKKSKKDESPSGREPVKVEDYGENELRLTFEDGTVEIVDKDDYEKE